MLPMHLPSLNLVCSKIQDEMHLQFYNKIHYLTFELNLEAKVSQHVDQYPPHYVTYEPAEFEVGTFNGLPGEMH